MASIPSRSEVFSLFRSLLRTARVFSDYNVREYAKRRTTDAFRQSRDLSDPSAVSAAFSDGKSQLEVAKRQSVVYSLYAPEVKNVMEIKKIMKNRVSDDVIVIETSVLNWWSFVRLRVERSVSYNEHRPRRPPPDLPSLLLHGRIVYVGMPLVPAVTELVIAELMYLQWTDPKEPIYIYINSTGTTRDDGETVGMESEGFAIYDAMMQLKNEID